MSSVSPEGGGSGKFNHESAGKGARGEISPVVPVLGSLVIPLRLVDDAEPTKKGTVKSIPIIMEVAIAKYERDLLRHDEGAAGESFSIVGFSLRTDLMLSRKRDCGARLENLCRFSVALKRLLKNF